MRRVFCLPHVDPFLQFNLMSVVKIMDDDHHCIGAFYGILCTKLFFMTPGFYNYATERNDILYTLTAELNVQKEDALKILSAVMRTTRDYLTIDQSLQLLAQLPVEVRAIYADDWDAGKQAMQLHNLNEFLDEVRGYDEDLASNELRDYASTGKAVRTVFKVLSADLCYGEFQDIVEVLPVELKELIQNRVGQKASNPYSYYSYPPAY